MVRKAAERILKNSSAAEDVAQETFIKYIQYTRKQKKIDHIAGFLFRVATNLALNQLRNSKRRDLLLQQMVSESIDVTVSIEDQIALRKVLSQVGELEAQIAAYYYIHGMNQREISDLLSLHRRKVSRLLEEFRTRARKLLG